MSSDLYKPFELSDFIKFKRTDLIFTSFEVYNSDAATQQNRYIIQTTAYLEYIQKWKPVNERNNFESLAELVKNLEKKIEEFQKPVPKTEILLQKMAEISELLKSIKDD